MQDLIYVALIFALTIVTALFVLACDKLVGPDTAALAERSREADAQPVRSTAHGQEAKVA
jgi:hypothetical protein